MKRRDFIKSTGGFLGALGLRGLVSFTEEASEPVVESVNSLPEFSGQVLLCDGEGNIRRTLSGDAISRCNLYR